MKKVLLLLSIIYAKQTYSQAKKADLNGPVKYSIEVEEKIRQVENSLYGRIKIEGDTNWALKERMAFYKINGLSIAVIHNYKTEWDKGYGWADVDEKRPVTTETYFQIGSISKSLNSIGVLKLAQNNKLNIYADINKYLTTWKFPYDSISHNKKITTANLLSHSAGLNGGGTDYKKTDALPTIYEILDGIKPATSAPVRSIFEPGSKFEYSNGGATISQLIIADITKKNYVEYMQETVLKPIGMTNSFYDEPAPKGKQGNLATGYDQSGEEIPGKYNLLTQQAGGSMWGTPSDFCKYIVETQLSYIGKSNKILNKEMTRIMLTPQTISSAVDNNVGLGVFIDKLDSAKYFKHTGSRRGFTSLYYGSIEDGNGLVVFLNSTNNSAILQEIVNSVATAYKWKGFSTPVTRKVILIPDSIISKYDGTYKVDGTIAAIIKKDNKYVYYSNGKFVNAYFTSDKDFFNLEFLADKHFFANKSGRVIGFTRTVGGKILSDAERVEVTDSLFAPHTTFNDLAWTELENKNFERAIQFYSRALALYPSEAYLYVNLGHAYLLNNEYQKAKKFYGLFLDKKFFTDYSKENMIRDDFSYLKSKGFSSVLMDEALKDFHLQKDSKNSPVAH